MTRNERRCGRLGKGAMVGERYDALLQEPQVAEVDEFVRFVARAHPAEAMGERLY